jgi:hypothetical protein
MSDAWFMGWMYDRYREAVRHHSSGSRGRERTLGNEMQQVVRYPEGVIHVYRLCALADSRPWAVLLDAFGVIS